MFGFRQIYDESPKEGMADFCGKKKPRIIPGLSCVITLCLCRPCAQLLNHFIRQGIGIHAESVYKYAFYALRFR